MELYLARACQWLMGAVANGTLLLMLAGLTTSVATISFGPPDSLHDLRGLMLRDLSDVFPAGMPRHSEDVLGIGHTHSEGGGVVITHEEDPGSDA